jgi:hypothetical protein
MPNSSPSKPRAMDGVFFGGFDKRDRIYKILQD